MNLFFKAFAVAAFAGSLGACASSSNRVTVQEPSKISKGQELSDLLRAKNENAVTAEEYEDLRKVILRRAQ